jgi:peptidyl-prolyl cis-trans isomerase C
VNSPLAESLADPFMFQDYYADRTPQAIAREFGPEFALAVANLAPGSWQGPLKSGYGWHLVFVDTVIPGRVPAFEEVEQDVKTAWLGEQKAEAWREAYEAMRAKYTVLLPVPADDAAAVASEAAGSPGALARDDEAPR